MRLLSYPFFLPCWRFIFLATSIGPRILEPVLEHHFNIFRVFLSHKAPGVRPIHHGSENGPGIGRWADHPWHQPVNAISHSSGLAHNVTYDHRQDNGTTNSLGHIFWCPSRLRLPSPRLLQLDIYVVSDTSKILLACKGVAYGNLTDSAISEGINSGNTWVVEKEFKSLRVVICEGPAFVRYIKK